MQTTHTQTDISISKKSEFQQKKTLEKKTKNRTHSSGSFSFLFTQHVSPSLYLPGLNYKGVRSRFCWVGSRAIYLSIYLGRQSNECDRECVLSALIEFRQIATADEQKRSREKKNLNERICAIYLNSYPPPPPFLFLLLHLLHLSHLSCWRGCSHFFTLGHFESAIFLDQRKEN